MTQRVADVLVETLQAAGVKRCYGIVGDTLNRIAHDIDLSNIEWVHMRHEEAGAFAAGAEHSSLSAYSASQTLKTATQTTFDSALAAYRNRVGSITDVTLATTQLLQAKNASTDAYSTALSAAATLALAAGALGTAPK